MKAGLVSDSHGDIDNLNRAVKLLVSEGVDVIIHLGDDAADIGKIKDPGVRLIAVPGVFENAYADKEIPNRILEQFDGVRVLITHTPDSSDKDLPGDLKPESVLDESSADLIVHGHTHSACITKKGGVAFVNPGHLKSSSGRGSGPSFGVVDFSEKKIKIISLGTQEVILGGEF